MHSTQPDPLLLDLYASATNPARWSSALDRLCAETGAHSAVLQAFRFDAALAHTQWSVQDSRTLQRHPLYAASISDGGNPRLDPMRALRGLNRIAGDNELFDPGDIAKPRLQQQLATLGLGRFIGTLQDVGGGIYLGLALHRAVADDGDFSSPQLERLAHLAPHIGQAYVLASQHQAQRELDEHLRGHVERLRCATVVCSADGAVRWFNRSAESLLGAQGPLRLDGHVLRARSARATDSLARVIRAAACDPEGGVHYLALGDAPAMLHVAARAVMGAMSDPAVMLVVTPVHAEHRIPANALATLFGLTQAEARLVGALVTGSSVEEYAQHRGISVGTVRGQLKQVQAKTGTRRQAELVRLVLSSAAAQ